jgi:hypothetical protein
VVGIRVIGKPLRNLVAYIPSQTLFEKAYPIYYVAVLRISKQENSMSQFRMGLSSKYFIPFLFLSLLAYAGTPQTSTNADKVTGTMTLDKNRIPLQHVYAYGYAGLEPSKKNISLLFSDRPMNEKIFRERVLVGPGEPLVSGLVEGAWKSMHFEKMFQGFVITINSEKRIIGNEVLVGGNNATFSLSSSDFVFEPKTFDTRISGRIRTATETMEAGDHVFGLDVSFDARVIDLP